MAKLRRGDKVHLWGPRQSLRRGRRNPDAAPRGRHRHRAFRGVCGTHPTPGSFRWSSATACPKTAIPWKASGSASTWNPSTRTPAKTLNGSSTMSARASKPMPNATASCSPAARPVPQGGAGIRSGGQGALPAFSGKPHGLRRRRLPRLRHQDDGKVARRRKGRNARADMHPWSVFWADQSPWSLAHGSLHRTTSSSHKPSGNTKPLVFKNPILTASGTFGYASSSPITAISRISAASW